MPAPTPPSESPRAEQSAAFTLGEADKELAEIRPDQDEVVLPEVTRGSVVIVIQCFGTGTVGFSVRDNGVFPVPCAEEGCVTYNQVVFRKKRRNVRIALHKQSNVESARALVGWNKRSPKQPRQIVTA